MDITVDVPDGVSGDWKVDTFTIDKPPLYFAMRGRSIPVGTYKRLMHKNEVVMSNTPAEIDDFRGFLYYARGNVLVNGLGLGVVLKALLHKDPPVKTITVIEKSEDVIKLVAPTFNNEPRVTIINADALTWKPPRAMYYDSVWHDIWDYICAENLKDMVKLHKKYGKRCSYQASWCRAQCQNLRRY